MTTEQLTNRLSANLKARDEIDAQIREDYGALGKEISPSANCPAVEEYILAIIASRFKLSSGWHFSRCRQEELAWPRQIAMFLIREVCNSTYAAIGRKFCRDHGTIMHACRSVRDRRTLYREDRQAINSLLIQARAFAQERVDK